MTAAGIGKGKEAKQRGNDAFRRGLYADAVGQYAEAILQDAGNHVYYLNRSMAYMKLSKFEDAERDASASLRLGGDNTKAYFRRGSARKQLARWEEARQDFEKVVQMDSSNTEAQAEIAYVQAKLDAETKRNDRKPLDIEALASNRAPVSSVEAARKFLEQVGLSNKDGDSNAPPTPSAPPNRFPGEDGGFLKEVSTRRMPKSNPALASSPISQSTSGIGKATEAPRLPVKPLEQSQEKRAPIRKSDVAADSSGGKLRLSAYEFYRRLHQCSGNGLNTEAKHKSQLALLASLDVQTIPTMLGSLLEPELLADVLAALLQGSEDSTSLIVDVMSVLPRCQRFETSWMCLEEAEKKRASMLLERVRKEAGEGVRAKVAALWDVDVAC